MKPTNIRYGRDDYGEAFMSLTWKGRDLILWRDQKPQFIESGYVYLGSNANIDGLVPPVQYTNPSWGVTVPKLIEGLAYDADLVQAWQEFANAVDAGNVP